MNKLQERCRKLNIRITWSRIGEELLFVIAGGDQPHVGAVYICDEVSGGNEGKELSLEGHRDIEIARPVALAAAETTGRKTTVLCGIHYDCFSDETKKMVWAFVAELEAEIRSGHFFSCNEAMRWE